MNDLVLGEGPLEGNLEEGVSILENPHSLQLSEGP